jgi:hypothetical protein
MQEEEEEEEEEDAELEVHPTVEQTQDSPSGIALEANPLPLATLIIDGESSQVKYIMETSDAFNDKDNILVMKLPAADTKALQPNDVMKGFQILHEFLRSAKSMEMNLDNV